MTVLIIPSAVRLRAKGSFELEGFSSITKKPTIVSILSEIDKAKLNGFLGIFEFIPIAKYCSVIAKEISLSKPDVVRNSHPLCLVTQEILQLSRMLSLFYKLKLKVLPFPCLLITHLKSSQVFSFVVLCQNKFQDL